MIWPGTTPIIWWCGQGHQGRNPSCTSRSIISCNPWRMEHHVLVWITFMDFQPKKCINMKYQWTQGEKYHWPWPQLTIKFHSKVPTVVFHFICGFAYYYGNRVGSTINSLSNVIAKIHLWCFILFSSLLTITNTRWEVPLAMAVTMRSLNLLSNLIPTRKRSCL